MLNKQQKGLKARTDGYKAEEIAVMFLRLKGYKILQRNFKPPRGIGAGEIDIIAKKKETVAFIEVKYRKTKEDSAEAVSSFVQQRQIKGAEYFLMKYPEHSDKELRFDVILMTPSSLPEHIKNAFICS